MCEMSSNMSIFRGFCPYITRILHPFHEVFNFLGSI
nr:MAG TPA: hypothetical protein [Caudoviricetes sp.]